MILRKVLNLDFELFLLDEIKEMEELNNDLLKKNNQYYYENKEEIRAKSGKNDKEYEKIINRLQNILFSEDII